MTTDEMIDVMARAIFACHFADSAEAQEMMKYDWQLPTSPLNIMVHNEARAALAAILPVMRDDIANEAFRFAQYVRDTATQVDAAIRARFDQIAKEIQ